MSCYGSISLTPGPENGFFFKEKLDGFPKDPKVLSDKTKILHGKPTEYVCDDQVGVELSLGYFFL